MVGGKQHEKDSKGTSSLYNMSGWIAALAISLDVSLSEWRKSVSLRVNLGN